MSDKSIIAGKHGQGLPIHELSAAPSSKGPRRHHTLRTEATAFLGEFIGTFMFLSLAFSGTQIALNAAGSSQLTQSVDKAPDVGKLLYIAFAFGVSLAINVAIFADVSGGKFNPAVSLTNAVCAPLIFVWCNHNILFLNANSFFV
jgi:aquaporin related protein